MVPPTSKLPASMSPEQHSSTTEPLDGVAVCLLGKLGGLSKSDVRSWIVQAGGRVVPPTDPQVQVIVLGADSFPFNLRELDDSLLQRVESGKITLLEEPEFWERYGERQANTDSDNEPAQLYTPAMLADLLKIPIRTIRRWHRLGLLSPVKEVCRLPYFDFQELAAARRLAGWLQTTSAEQVEKKLVQLAKILPGARRPLSQLPIIVEGKQVLLRQMSGLIEPNGQLRFDFDQWNEAADEIVESIIAFPQTGTETASHGGFANSATKNSQTEWPAFCLQSPEDGLRMAIEFEDEQDWDSAIHVYRAMLVAYGPSSDWCFQIGELLYRQGELTAARERYSMAVELDAEFLEARANLGCVLMELDQWEHALAAFSGALDLHPDYADVLFHIASVCEKLNRWAEAQQHWRHFLQVAPSSPWAVYARGRLEKD